MENEPDNQTERHLGLLRHAKSAWGNPGLADFDRPLSPRGERAIAAMSIYLKQKQLAPDIVYCSSALRTRMTWDAIESVFSVAPTIECSEAIYRADGSGLFELLRGTDPGHRNVLVIGHQPALSELALFLMNRRARAGNAGVAARFPTAGFVLLGLGRQDWRTLAPNSAELLDAASPKQLV